MLYKQFGTADKGLLQLIVIRKEAYGTDDFDKM